MRIKCGANLGARRRRCRRPFSLPGRRAYIIDPYLNTRVQEAWACSAKSFKLTWHSLKLTNISRNGRREESPL